MTSIRIANTSIFVFSTYGQLINTYHSCIALDMSVCFAQCEGTRYSGIGYWTGRASVSMLSLTYVTDANTFRQLFRGLFHDFSRAHEWNVMEILFATIVILMILSTHKLAHLILTHVKAVICKTTSTTEAWTKWRIFCRTQFQWEFYHNPFHPWLKRLQNNRYTIPEVKNAIEYNQIVRGLTVTTIIWHITRPSSC